MNFEKGVWINELFQKGDIDNSYSQRYCNGDTIVNDQLAYKLFEIEGWPKLGEPGLDLYGPKLIGFIYENENRQVLYKDITEKDFIIAYDFNLNLGDTIDQGDPTGDYYFQFIINDIDSVEICGKYHKRYINDLYGGTFPYTLTEGIGFSNGILGFRRLIDFEAYDHLLCYTEWGNSSCTDCDILVGKNEMSIQTTVFPNPAGGNIEIRSNSEMLLLSIIDINGKTIFTQDNIFSSSVIVPSRKFPPGLYLIKVKFIDSQASSTRFIKY